MTSSVEHAKKILAAIIPNREDLLDRALRDLTPEQIPDRILSTLLSMLERYSEITQGSILTRDAMTDMLSGARVDTGTVAAFQETYDELVDLKADDAAFRWSLVQIREQAADRETNKALTEGMEILTRGTVDNRGESIRGHAAARQHILNSFAEIDRSLSMQDAPEGDMRDEGAQLLAEYNTQEQLHRDGLGGGIHFGVPALDVRLGGIHNGELILIVGSTSDGKTSLCVQLAWSAAVQQNKNVLFLTTETVRNTVRRRIIARHSCLDMFGKKDGINSRDLKDGTLTEQDKRRYEAVVKDFHGNAGYGRLYIAQVPRGASMSYIESKIVRVSRSIGVDLVIMDYLALLRPDRRRETTREELSNTLKAAKQISTTVRDGLGVPFVSPWQVSRASRSEADKLGHYTLSALSETAETSNSSDTIISLLAPLDDDSRCKKVKVQLLKHRDGEKANSIEMLADYATCRFTGDHTLASPVSVLDRTEAMSTYF